MKATWNGAVLAESADTVVVEGNHYFPPDSLNREFFRDSDYWTWSLRTDEVDLRRDVDAARERSIDGAGVGMHPVHSLGRLSLIVWNDQAVLHVDPADHQDAVLLLDLAVRFGCEPAIAR